MNVEIGKAQMTPQIAEILADWQVSDNKRLLWHLEALEDIQDYMCVEINDELTVEMKEKVGEYLRNLVQLKNDLKKLIIVK